MITKCYVYLMFYSMHLLLDPSPFPPEDLHGHSWEEESGAKSIGRAINPCRVYWTAKDNTVITAIPTQISSPAHGWGQGQGQMVFFYAGRDNEATQTLKKAPELVSVELGTPHRGKVSHQIGLDPGKCSCSFCQKTSYKLLPLIPILPLWNRSGSLTFQEHKAEAIC